jgi:hypothetical protein
VNLKQPAVCEKINPNVIGHPGQRDSIDFTYMQSDCYRNLAAMLRFPQLCSHVKSAGTDRLISSRTSKASCRNHQYMIGTSMSGTPPNLIGVMRSLGIGDERLAEWLYEERPSDYLDPVLEALRTDPAFLSRLSTSPNYDEPFSLGKRRDAHPLEFLGDMIAVRWDIPSLCKKISPNAQAREFNGYFGLRNACFFGIASNRKDESLCKDLGPTLGTLKPDQGVAYQACVKNVRILRDPRTHLQWFRYWGSYFPTWSQLQESMQQLGYPTSTPWLQLPRPAPEQYENYFASLSRPQNFTARGFHSQSGCPPLKSTTKRLP